MPTLVLWQERSEVVRINEVTLDRKDTRVRKCWWLSGCCSREITLGSKSLTKVRYRYTIEVTEDEARNGKGRECPYCNKVMGCYVCDGFPTFQGSVVFSDKKE